MRKWLDQEGKETAVLQFFTVEGKSMLFVYTTTDQFNAEDELKIDIPDDASELFNN
jgi:putative heme iron utilization protein